MLLAKLAKGRTLVLTPHPGEMARLAGMTVAEVQAKRLETARGFAERLGVTVVLKGARTLIAHPDGRGGGEYDRESRRWRRAAAAIC